MEFGPQDFEKVKSFMVTERENKSVSAYSSTFLTVLERTLGSMEEVGTAQARFSGTSRATR